MPLNAGSRAKSKRAFLFGSFQMLIKLVPGNSAGTVSSFYVSLLFRTYAQGSIKYLKKSLLRGHARLPDVHSASCNQFHQEYSFKPCRKLDLLILLAPIFVAILGWGQPRRDRFRVPWQCFGTTLYYPHKPLRSWTG